MPHAGNHEEGTDDSSSSDDDYDLDNKADVEKMILAKMAIPEFWRKTNTGVPFSSKSADFVVKSFWQYVLQTKKKGQSNHEFVHGLLPATPWDRKKAVEFLDKYWKFGAVRNLVCLPHKMTQQHLVAASLDELFSLLPTPLARARRHSQNECLGQSNSAVQY